MFRVNDLDGDEVVVDVSTGEKEEQSEKVVKKEVSTTNPVTTAGEVVTTVDVEVSAALTTTTKIDDELTLAQTLIEIKAAKLKALTTAATTVTAEEERGELSIAEKSKLFVELMNKRKNHFEVLRAKERMRKPPTKVQKRKQIFTYLKNMAGFTHNQLKSKIFEEVQQAFNKTIDWINNFVAMNSEPVKDKAVESSKRPREELESNKSKKQKLDENVQAEVANDDTAELKRCMEIVLEDDDEVTIEATPLSSKSPTIVDYKIYKEGKKSYFKIIRADGNSQNYLAFGKMSKNFNIEDLKVLRSIVKKRFEKTKPVNDMDNLLFQTLKTMFED
uniref:Uncharacterized protein n=1 Tax=Tanacetum cinerariifolium TaxID=118510 RepID=A0A6L2ML37_TANCI|nr:hypothetical protein [Tanacetum cinerariifolium]